MPKSDYELPYSEAYNDIKTRYTETKQKVEDLLNSIKIQVSQNESRAISSEDFSQKPNLESESQKLEAALQTLDRWYRYVLDKKLALDNHDNFLLKSSKDKVKKIKDSGIKKIIKNVAIHPVNAPQTIFKTMKYNRVQVEEFNRLHEEFFKSLNSLNKEIVRLNNWRVEDPKIEDPMASRLSSFRRPT